MKTTKHDIKTKIEAHVTICSSTYCEKIPEAKVYLHFRKGRLAHIDVEHPRLEEILGRKGGGYYELSINGRILVIDLSKLLLGLQLLIEIPGLSKQDVIIETKCYVRGKKRGLFIGTSDKHVLKLLEDLVKKYRHVYMNNARE